jgi:hypothetical protein
MDKALRQRALDAAPSSVLAIFYVIQHFRRLSLRPATQELQPCLYYGLSCKRISVCILKIT